MMIGNYFLPKRTNYMFIVLSNYLKNTNNSVFTTVELILKDCNIEKSAKSSSYIKGNTRVSYEQTVAELICSRNRWGVYSTSFERDWWQSHQKTVPRIQQERVPHIGGSVQIGRISLKPAVTDILWNRSKNTLERLRGKLGTELGSFRNWFPS